MQNSEQGEFNYMVETWAAQWPSSKWQARHTAAFWMVLRLFTLNDVSLGLQRAAHKAAKSDFTRNKIPSAETVAEFCKELEHERRRNEARRKLEAEEREARISMAHVPTDPDQAAAYIAAGENQFEQFARQCEVESKALGLDPQKPTPGELGKRRSLEMQKLLGSITKEMP